MKSKGIYLPCPCIVLVLFSCFFPILVRGENNFLATHSKPLPFKSGYQAFPSSSEIPKDFLVGFPFNEIKADILPFFQELDSENYNCYSFSEANRCMEFRFLPQKFQIHGRTRGGEILKEPHHAIGPSFRGLILKMFIQRKGTINPAVLPQTIQEPYWTTDLGVVELRNFDKQLYYGLSYGC